MRKLFVFCVLTVMVLIGTAAMRANNLVNCTVTVQNAPEGMEVKVFILEENKDNPNHVPTYVYRTQAPIGTNKQAIFNNLPKGFTYAFVTTYVAGYTISHSNGHTITKNEHSVSMIVQRVDQ